MTFAFVLAGCSGNPNEQPAEVEVAKAGYAYDGPGSLFAGPPLYADPQNTPHPAYNWPTLSHPAIGTNVPEWWRPAQTSELPATIAELQHVASVPGVERGAGITLFGSLAVVPSFHSGMPSGIVDIRDPTDARLLSQFETQVGDGHRGAVIIAYPTGRLVTVLATLYALDVWDITDPRQPEPLPVVELPFGTAGSHKIGVVPGTPILYNAASWGGEPELGMGGPGAHTGNGASVTEMFDFSDPENPVRLPDFKNGYSCHHIFFWNNVEQEKYRAICAGVEYTQIIDTAEPLNPEVIVSIPYGLGNPDLPSTSVFAQAFSHTAGLSLDGSILYVGDENGGGTTPLGCVARVDSSAGAASIPVGAIWFYDVTTETQPRYVGHVSASQLDRLGHYDPTTPAMPPSCTAHHGRLVPAGDLLAMSFYGAGVLLIDFAPVRSEPPGNPRIVARFTAEGINVWETWYYNGFLFTGDLGRGMDVLALA